MINPRSAKKKKGPYYIPLSQEDDGFRWGPALVSRLHADISDGSVVIGLGTDREEVQVRITRTGRIRVHNVKAT